MKKYKIKNLNLRLAIVGGFSAILLAIVLTLVYVQFFGYSKDYANYQSFINFALTGGCDLIDERPRYAEYDGGFRALVCTLSNISSSSSSIEIYSILVLISFLPKLFTISTIFLRSNPIFYGYPIVFLFSLLFYFCRFFPLHEFTQIRVSIGLGFSSIAVILLSSIKTSQFSKFIKEKNIINLIKDNFIQVLSFSLIFSMSVLFHKSTLFMLPLIVLAQFSDTRKNILLNVFLVCIFCIFFSPLVGQNFSSIDNLGADRYEKFQINEAMNPIPISKILDIGMGLTGLLVVDVTKKNQSVNLCIFLFSLSIFYGLYISSTNYFLSQVLIYRLSEMPQMFGTFFIASLTNRKQILFMAPWIISSSLWNLWYMATNNYFYQ